MSANEHASGAQSCLHLSEGRRALWSAAAAQCATWRLYQSTQEKGMEVRQSKAKSPGEDT